MAESFEELFAPDPKSVADRLDAAIERYTSNPAGEIGFYTEAFLEQVGRIESVTGPLSMEGQRAIVKELALAAAAGYRDRDREQVGGTVGKGRRAISAAKDVKRQKALQLWTESNGEATAAEIGRVIGCDARTVRRYLNGK